MQEDKRHWHLVYHDSSIWPRQSMTISYSKTPKLLKQSQVKDCVRTVGSFLEIPFCLGKHKSYHGLMVGSAANDITYITEVCHLCCHPWRKPVVVQATTRPLILQKDANRIFKKYMGVSENSGTPKSSISIGFSIKNHSFWGTSIFGNTHI